MRGFLNFRFDLTTLRLFMAVAEEKNIAKAAKRSNIAASAISKRVLDLETELRTPLIERRRVGVELTVAGVALYGHCRHVFTYLERLNSEMCSYATGAKGLVRISGNASAVVLWLPAAVKTFIKKHPDIVLSLQEEFSHRTVELIRDGMVDVGIIGAAADVKDLRVVDYRTDRLVIMASVNHPLAAMDGVYVEDTLSYNHLGLDQGASLHNELLEAAKNISEPLRLSIRVKSFDALRHLAQQDIGITILPESCVRPYEAMLGIKAIPLLNDWANRTLRLCYRDGAENSKPVALVIEELVGKGGVDGVPG